MNRLREEKSQEKIVILIAAITDKRMRMAERSNKCHERAEKRYSGNKIAIAVILARLSYFIP